MIYRIFSVGGGGGVGRCRYSDSVIASVVDRVESLEEGLSKDEVQSRSTAGAIVLNNQIDATGNTTNSSVEATRPDLSVRG